MIIHTSRAAPAFLATNKTLALRPPGSTELLPLEIKASTHDCTILRCHNSFECS